MLAWFCLAMGIGLVAGYITISGADLFNNAVLDAKPIAPAQQMLLFVDASYVDSEVLTVEQRGVILTRVILYAVLFTLVFRMLLDSLGVVYWETWIGQAINQNLRVKMIENAEHLSLKTQSHARTGDAIYRVFQDSRMISNVIATIILDPLEQGAALLGAFVIIWFFSPALGLLFTAACVPIFLLAVWWTPRIQRLSWLSRQSNSDVTSRIQEVAQGVRVLKANQAEDIAVGRFDRDSRTALDYAFVLRREIVLFMVAMATIAGVVLIVADYLMADWTVAADPTFLGGLFAFILTFTIWNLGAFQTARGNNSDLMGKYNFLFITWFRAIDMAMGLNRAYYLLDLKPGVEDKDNAVSMPAPIADVCYSNVGFSYEPDQPVLRGADLTARVGTITAIVGATGSGKSTLMSLLLRLYDPDAGTITVNGVDLRDIAIDSIRAQRIHRLAAERAVRGHGGRQHRLRRPRRYAGADSRGGDRRLRTRLHRGDDARLRNGTRRTRRQTLHRPTPAVIDRPRDRPRHADSDSRRTDCLTRCGNGTAGTRQSGRLGARARAVRDNSSPVHHSQRGSDRVSEGWADHRSRHSRRVDGQAGWRLPRLRRGRDCGCRECGRPVM